MVSYGREINFGYAYDQNIIFENVINWFKIFAVAVWPPTVILVIYIYIPFTNISHSSSILFLLIPFMYEIILCSYWMTNIICQLRVFFVTEADYMIKKSNFPVNLWPCNGYTSNLTIPVHCVPIMKPIWCQ